MLGKLHAEAAIGALVKAGDESFHHFARVQLQARDGADGLRITELLLGEGHQACRREDCGCGGWSLLMVALTAPPGEFPGRQR